jgi:hypothetical protein
VSKDSFEDLASQIKSMNSFKDQVIGKWTGHTVQVDGTREFFTHENTTNELLREYFFSSMT